MVTSDNPVEYFDFQVNGFGGVDFQAADVTLDQMAHAVSRLAAHRTSGIFLTLITDQLDALMAKLRRIEDFRRQDKAVARMVQGYHIEGPWLSSEPGYCGAHQPALMRNPNMDDFNRMQDAANGHIRLVTLAPERPGSIPVIEMLVGNGTEVALGHTNASLDAIEAAATAGARLVTHLGNGVPTEVHRHDNVIQRLLSCEALTICLIPDGIHLPPFVLKNFFAARGLEKVLFTTDCMAAAGAGPGEYRLLDIQVEVGDDGVVRLPGSRRFAGSSLTMDVAASNLARWLGLSRATADAICGDKVREFFGVESQ